MLEGGSDVSGIFIKDILNLERKENAVRRIAPPQGETIFSKSMFPNTHAGYRLVTISTFLFPPPRRCRFLSLVSLAIQKHEDIGHSARATWFPFGSSRTFRSEERKNEADDEGEDEEKRALGRPVSRLLLFRQVMISVNDDRPRVVTLAWCNRAAPRYPDQG